MKNESISIRKAVLVISTGRTGTDFIAKRLGSNLDGVSAVQEELGGRRIRLASNAYQAKRISKSFLRKLLLARYRPRLSRIRQPILLEANPYLYGCLDVIDDVFPNATVVHVVRDPRSYIQSHMNFGAFRGLRGIAGSIVPFWWLRPERTADHRNLCWNRMPNYLKLAWRWQFVNETLLKNASQFPNRYHVVHYENIFHSDYSGLKLITELCNSQWNPDRFIPLTKLRINKSRSARFPNWREWSTEMGQQVHSLCGELMHRFGYGTEQQWKDLITCLQKTCERNDDSVRTNCRNTGYSGISV